MMLPPFACRTSALVGILLLTACNVGSDDGQSPESSTNSVEPTVTTPAASPRNPLAEPPAGVALTLAEPAPSALFHAAYQRVEDDWVQLLYLCDGVDGDRIKLISMPNARGLSTLWTYTKPAFSTTRETVRLGDSDPGAGSIYREVQRPDGSAFGNVHAINPGMLGDANVTTLPTLVGITDKAETTRCRWTPRGRVLLVDSRRSVLVTAEPDGTYTYRSFDHAEPGKVIGAGGGATNVATTTVNSGRLIAAEANQEIYEFTNEPWTYRVVASADNRAPGASVTVLRDGEPVQTHIAAAYEIAAKRIE